MTDASAIFPAGDLPSTKRRRWFPIRPSHQREIYYGLVLRILVGLVSIVAPLIFLVIVGFFNGWQLTDAMLVIFAMAVSGTILFGEHLRSLAYERLPPIEDDGDHEIVSILEEAPAQNLKTVSARIIQKRVFDIVAASLSILVLLPLFLVVAIAIKLDSSGPVLFRSRRRDFSGREFTVLRFRTMQVMAVNVHLPDGSERRASRDDPRVTPLGRILRRGGIADLPMLFSVLAGNTSIVGPRARSITEDERLTASFDEMAFRLSVKPGIFGVAQLDGADDLRQLRTQLELEQRYIERWSLWLDLKIIARSALQMLRY